MGGDELQPLQHAGERRWQQHAQRERGKLALRGLADGVKPIEPEVQHAQQQLLRLGGCSGVVWEGGWGRVGVSGECVDRSRGKGGNR